MQDIRLPHSVMSRTMDFMLANRGPCGCERNRGRQGFANAKRMRKGDDRGAKGKRWELFELCAQ